MQLPQLPTSFHSVSDFSKCSLQLQQLQQLAKKYLHQSLHSQESQPSQQIETYIRKYFSIKDFLQEICSNQYDSKQNQNFWKLNEQIQRNVEENLQKLKQLDNSIDDITKREFYQYSLLEDIENKIRLILTQKSLNHIKKTQPLLAQKDGIVQNLRMMKKEVEKCKELKLRCISELLEELCDLKAHRQSKMQEENKWSERQLELLRELTEDLEKMLNNKLAAQSLAKDQDKHNFQLEDSTARMDRLYLQLKEQYDFQEELLHKIRTCKHQKEELLSFQRHLTSVLSRKDAPSLQLFKFKQFFHQQEVYSSEIQNISSGIQTTTQTIAIFQHILQTLLHEKQQKLNFICKIEALQQKYSDQNHKYQQIQQIQGEVEALSLKRNRLSKKMEEKAEQANVSAYRLIHQEIQSIAMQFQKRKQALEEMNKQASERAKTLFLEANSINDEFKDILHELVPHVWFRDQEFAKAETIRDLSLYLSKTFSKLNLIE